MSDIDIVLKAIDKATEGGWEKADIWLELMTSDEVALPAMNNYIYRLIFSHDFAKTLWGEKPENHLFGVSGIPLWQYHLQQMVIADDPIAYLGENLT